MACSTLHSILLLHVWHAWLVPAVFAGDTGDTLSMVQSRVIQHTEEEETRISRCQVKAQKDELEPSVAAQTEIVVIRGSGEDVRWLDSFHEVPTVLYNRNGLEEQLPQARPNLRIIAQPNVGAQDECMLGHIIDNYDQLPAVTLFLQGWPFWHCAGTFQDVRRALRNALSLQDHAVMSNGAQRGLVPLSASFHQYTLTGGWVGNWHSLMDGQRTKTHTKREEMVSETIKSYNATCAEVLGNPCPDSHWVAEGAQWAVSSDRIRSQPVSFYRRLRDLQVSGDELHQRRLRGLVLEALWPALWGTPDWSPGDAVKQAQHRRSTKSAQTADAVGAYCHFSSSRTTGSSTGRQGVCELEQHAAGNSGGSIALVAGRWNATMRLVFVPDLLLTKDMAVARDTKRPQPLPCNRLHIWPFATGTRVRNRRSGRCIEPSDNGFSTTTCSERLGDQKLNLLSNQNRGYFQIQDGLEVSCLTHDNKSSSASKCKLLPDGSAYMNQQWELLHQGSGVYVIKARNGTCLSDASSGLILTLESCSDPSALWELMDVRASAQYLERLEYSPVRLQDGSIRLRCNQHLRSSDQAADLDVVEPGWRKHGQSLSFQLEDGPDGSHYLLDSTSQEDRYLGCDKTTREAVFLEAKTAWRINTVSGAYVHLTSGKRGSAHERVLQMGAGSESGVLKCGYHAVDSVPPKDMTFEAKFEPLP